MISICLLAPKYHVEALSHLCSLARSPNASSSLARMEMIAYSSREFLISHPPRRQGFLRARKRKRERGREGRFCISRAICSQCTSTAASCLSLSSRAWPIPSIRPQFRFCWAFHSISIQSGGSEVSFRDEIDAVGSVALKLHAGVASRARLGGCSERMGHSILPRRAACCACEEGLFARSADRPKWNGCGTSLQIFGLHYCRLSARASRCLAGWLAGGCRPGLLSWKYSFRQASKRRRRLSSSLPLSGLPFSLPPPRTALISCKPPSWRCQIRARSTCARVARRTLKPCSCRAATGERVVPFAVMNSSPGRTSRTHIGLARSECGRERA